jgi:hypothetical protein
MFFTYQGTLTHMEVVLLDRLFDTVAKKYFNCNTFYRQIYSYARFEVFTAVTMKNSVFWDVVLVGSCVN